MGYRLSTRLVLGLALAAVSLTVAGIWGASSSQAAITLGSDLGTEPNGTTSCSSGMTTRGCLAIDDVLPGRALAVPSGMVGVIDRWNVRLGDGTQAQSIRIRVVRRVTTNTFTVISSGALRDIPAGAGTYSFPEQLSISPGDQVGLEADSGTGIEWRAPLPGANSFEFNPSPPDGGTTDAPVFTNPDEQHTFNVEFEPTNTFTLGPITRNKKKGTATITVENLLNAGELTGSGSGAKVASARAVASKSVGAGQAQLLIKAKGKKKRKLNQTGKVKLKVAITYTPTGGDPRTQSVKVKLKKKL